MWQKTDGVAYFTGEPTRAALKVSFFGPFYGGYNVIALDKDYRYALVCGPDRDYLWLLARTPKIPPEVKQQMLDIATRQGFDVSKLLWVNQQLLTGVHLQTHDTHPIDGAYISGWQICRAGESLSPLHRRRPDFPDPKGAPSPHVKRLQVVL
jgi:hypothetical protein